MKYTLKYAIAGEEEVIYSSDDYMEILQKQHSLILKNKKKLDYAIIEVNK